MYRGRPPPRGGHPPPFEGRETRPYPPGKYGVDRSRPRPPYQHERYEHGHLDSHRRSPTHRRYPSPGSPRRHEWPGGQPRAKSPSAGRSLPHDHNLVITVGNELNALPGSAPKSGPDRGFPVRPDGEDGRSRSPFYSRARSRGRSKSRHRSRSYSPNHGRAKSGGRSRSRSRSSQDRGRAKSRGRSKSRHRSRSRGRSHRDSMSRSKSRSWSRSRSRSRGRSKGRAGSRGRSKSRGRSRSSSSSSSSSSGYMRRENFKELENARRRKQMEEMLSQPTKSILKKRNDTEDSPSIRSMDSPRTLPSSNMSQLADQLMQAMKGMEPHMMASVLSELRSDPQMAQRPGFDAEIKEILTLIGGTGAKPQAKPVDDIDDEEKFLYGDSEEPKPQPQSEPSVHHGSLFGTVTEDNLYEDFGTTQPPHVQPYTHPQGVQPHHQAPAAVAESDIRYVGQPSSGLKQKIVVQVAKSTNAADSEGQMEYEKIQELLKTIGLDLGVTEISKIAARTKERLQGNKPPKTPTRRRQYSSDSSKGSGDRRRHSSSSSSNSSSSRSRSRGRNKKTGSWSSEDGHKKLVVTRSVRDTKGAKAEQPAAVPPMHTDQQQTTSDTMAFRPHLGVTIPTYPPPQTHGMMPPNYPPPGYGQYGTYMPLMQQQQQWPPMFPPHNMSLPPTGGTENYPPTQPYHNRGSDSGIEVSVKTSAQNSEKNEAKLGSHERKTSDEQNKESQKQKVLEEREKLKQDREIRMKKKEYLIKELEQLRKQQGELLRKKRREKEGHKDPLLQEISRLQEDVMMQISNLRKEHEAAEKKRSEIEKVAIILGLNPSDRPRKANKPVKDPNIEFPPAAKNREAEKSLERQQPSINTKLQIPEASVDLPSSEKKKPPVKESPVTPEPFEYYDAGNHWCKSCNVTSGSMFDFFTHLHSKTHRKTLDPYNRPWASTTTEIVKNLSTEEKMTKPAKGSEFLLPVRGFFCVLCQEFYGDAICAEEHVTTHAHNENYKKQLYETPLYEQRRNLDRQAGLTVDVSAKKRKHDDDENVSKDEKSKHKKEKKDKEKKKDEIVNTLYKEQDKIQVKTEEVEQVKPSRKENERPFYSKEKDESHKGSRKDDKYSYKQQDEERSDRYKDSKQDDHRFRYPNRKDQFKYTDEDSYKYGKHYRTKYDKERDERAVVKKPEPIKPVVQPEVNKPEAPSKPSDPPKIICGPSPAMRAKLRKQILDAGKSPTSSSPMTFGKLTWKKKENILAKEAEKVAADFTKEDEEAAKKPTALVTDSLAKTMAVAKEIAEKLGQPTRPHLPGNKDMTWTKPPVTNQYISQPNPINKLAAPIMYPTIRPYTVPQQTPQLNNPVIAQNYLWGNTPQQTITKPVSSKVPPPPGVSSPTPSQSTAKLPDYRPTPPAINIPPPVNKQSFTEKKPTLVSDPKPPPVVAPSAVPKSKPEPSKVVDSMPDVLAPGVPESEQTHAVFVKPPPFLTMNEKVHKPEKLKSNLAAAKAQDLFDIFYNNQKGLSFTTPNTKVDKVGSVGTVGSGTASPLPSLEAKNPQPQPPVQTQSEPLPVVNTCPEETPTVCLPNQQKEPESVLQILSDCSPAPDVALSEISPSLQSTLTLETEVKIQKSPEPKSISEPASVSSPQSNLAKPDPVPQPQIETSANSEENKNELPHLECNPPVTPEPESKPGPKTRGKKTPPAPHPVRQTRYQTRRQQVQSCIEPEPEPEPEASSVESEPAASDPKEVEGSNTLPESQSEEFAPSEEDPGSMEITPETLGLPSDMTSLDFDFDFNFV